MIYFRDILLFNSVILCKEIHHLRLWPYPVTRALMLLRLNIQMINFNRVLGSNWKFNTIQLNRKFPSHCGGVVKFRSDYLLTLELRWP